LIISKFESSRSSACSRQRTDEDPHDIMLTGNSGGTAPVAFFPLSHRLFL
jgi:hypothetical protein